jgi:4-aminobutyrate--pyruvate transaminase
MNKFQSALRGFKDHPLVGEVRAEGLIAGIQLMADGERRIPFDPAEKVGARFTEHALKEGWITRALGDTIAFCPPLIINAEEIDVLTDMVRATLDATYRAVSSRADR